MVQDDTTFTSPLNEALQEETVRAAHIEKPAIPADRFQDRLALRTPALGATGEPRLPDRPILGRVGCLKCF